MGEGYIKFQCNWIWSDPIPQNEISELNRWRNRLYELRLIGVCPVREREERARARGKFNFSLQDEIRQQPEESFLLSNGVYLY